MNGRTNAAVSGGAGKQRHVTFEWTGTSGMKEYHYCDGAELISNAGWAEERLEFDMPAGLLCARFDYKGYVSTVSSGDATLIEESNQGGALVDMIACYYVYGDCIMD